MAYGQHQSFYLRDRWLSKAIKQLKKDSRFFYDKEAFEKIGLGKNMVQSLRFWVVATNLAEEQTNDERKKVHLLTKFGDLIDEYDRHIQFVDTASLLHYQLSSNFEPSTVWFWFFNILDETTVSKEDLFRLFSKWVVQNEEKRVSEKSLKRDIDCLIKLYTAGQTANDPEEVIQSPLNKLNVMSEKNGMIFKKTPNSIEEIGLSALYFSLLDYCSKNSVEMVSVDEIIYQDGLWGNVFNMNRNLIIQALHQLTNHPLHPITFTRTNNLDTVRVPKVDPLEYLKDEYSRKVYVQS
ncbi:DUF4007 family protein [Pontibacillus marinus]|uniref:DUF4007 domain-containing protein n=1 Tax=Pontibacillus marinus BH030004 = DSM 16465 TaxID=1385511 RepID=A0A0A5GL20_9BACI|nr:DUF4007 family protein [Pontibacillus marinus]KGX91860.1 hypothetical protein N783_00195 [Pontibacillus marinus BH030004 = DSM 16465]